MKHVAHLLSADIRRFRVLLAVWVLIQIVDTVFKGVRPALGLDSRLLVTLDLLAALLYLIQWLGLIVLVPLVVQTHPLVGSDAFWMTRPIPWRSLVASKLVLLGTTFVAVPALCELALMQASRVPPATIPFVTLQTILFHSFWLLLVMALAATTRNLARFALVVGSVLVALVLFINVAIAVLVRSMSQDPKVTVVTARLHEGAIAGAVMVLLLIAAAAVQIAVQYRTRSTRASVTAGAAVASVAILSMFLWPSHERPLPVPEWARQDSALQLVAASRRGEFTPLHPGAYMVRSADWQMGGMRARLRGIEPGWLPGVRLVDGSVQFGDGTTLTTAENGQWALVPFEAMDGAPNLFVMRQVLGVGRVRGGTHAGGPLEAVPAILVREADFQKYSGATGTYRGRFLVDLDHVEIAAVLPLEAGAEFQESRRRIVIDQIVPRAQGASIRLRQFTASTVFDAHPLPHVSFYLRNRGADEAVAGSPHETMGLTAGLGLAFLFGMSGYSPGQDPGFTIASGLIGFHGDVRPGEPVVDISADWLSRAELVIVRTVTSGSVPRTLEISGFEIAPAPPRPPG